MGDAQRAGERPGCLRAMAAARSQPQQLTQRLAEHLQRLQRLPGFQRNLHRREDASGGLGATNATCVGAHLATAVSSDTSTSGTTTHGDTCGRSCSSVAPCAQLGGAREVQQFSLVFWLLLVMLDT